MKKLVFSFMALVTLMFLGLTSCEKEDLNPDYDFTITVMTYQDSILVPGAYVEVMAPVQGNTIFFEGIANEKGEISFKHDRDGILLVKAIRGDKQNPSQIGCNDVRLEANVNVRKTIYIKDQDPDIPGC